MAIITLPGLIDPHVHLRDPGQTEKEDFRTGTEAALAGGFTTILDMPNNKIPITTTERLENKVRVAQEKIVCDVGFYFGSLGDNLEEFERVKDFVFGLKLYLNVTTGHFIIDREKLETIYKVWNSRSPILVHAEEDVIPHVIDIVKKTGKTTHLCHISSRNELGKIIEAKENNLPITCGVTPHHLFLTEGDEKNLGPIGIMKPRLKPIKDVEFLWSKLAYIDVVESDHAPHTISEKENPPAGGPPSGVTNLETTLPLLLLAYNNDRLSLDDIKRLCFDDPKKIFSIPTDETTRIEIDTDIEYEIKNENLKTKSKWSPFNGWKVKGKVERVYLRGNLVFENGQILAKSGTGKIIKPLA